MKMNKVLYIALIVLLLFSASAYAACKGLTVNDKGKIDVSLPDNSDSCGGHAVECHVTIKDEELGQRYAGKVGKCMQIKSQKSKSSRFASKSEAESAIEKALNGDIAKVKDFIEGKTANLPAIKGGSAKAEWVERDKPTEVQKGSLSSTTVVLRKNGDTTYILTAYPSE